MNTWWVDYSWKYEAYDYVDDQWYVYEDSDARRFHCKKMELKKEIKKNIEDNELHYCDYRKLKIKINDMYITTDCEI